MPSRCRWSGFDRLAMGRVADFGADREVKSEHLAEASPRRTPPHRRLELPGLALPGPAGRLARGCEGRCAEILWRNVAIVTLIPTAVIPS
jgi:hypothetical protein